MSKKIEKVMPLSAMTTTSMHNTTTCADDTPKEEFLNIKECVYPVARAIVKSKEKQEKFISEEVPRLIEKYGAIELDEHKADELARAEREIAICEKCIGLPCARGDTARPFIHIEEGFDKKRRAVIRYGLCKYQKAQNKMKRLDKAFKAAKIPPQYRDKTFSDYKVTADNSTAVKAAKNFLQNQQGGLFFFGNPGTGKTFLASIVTQEFLKSNKSVIFGDVPTLLEVLRGSFDDKNTKITDLMDDLSTVDLLVLDDLGTEIPTEWAVERIYSIINQRYNAEKPVIVTSNLELGKLAWRLNHPKKTYNQKDDDEKFPNVNGDRIISRLVGMCERIELTGRDWRF